jgi:hypothetical protein
VIAEETAQPSQEPAHVLVSILGRLLGPEGLDQLRQLGWRKAVKHEVREEHALLASCEALIDAATVHRRREATAELNTVSLRVRRSFFLPRGHAPYYTDFDGVG